MSEGNTSDPVLAQLTILTQLIQSQSARLDKLEMVNTGVAGNATDVNPAGVGDTSRSDETPPGNGPGMRDGAEQSQSEEQTRDKNNALSFQH